MDNSPWGEPIYREPINICPLAGLEISFFEQETSEWVKKKIKGSSKFLGMHCDKFEEEIMALFASIEASHKKDVLS